MQTQTNVTQLKPQAAKALTPRVAGLVEAKRDAAENRLRTAIARRSQAEADLERAKAALADTPDDSKLLNDRRSARMLLEDASDDHELALSARDGVLKGLDAAVAQIAELSRLDHQIGAGLQAQVDAACARGDKAITELCEVYREARRRFDQEAELRQRAEALAAEIGIPYNLRAQDFDHDLGPLRRAAHKAVQRGQVFWRDLVNAFLVGY